MYVGATISRSYSRPYLQQAFSSRIIHYPRPIRCFRAFDFFAASLRLKLLIGEFRETEALTWAGYNMMR